MSRNRKNRWSNLSNSQHTYELDDRFQYLKRQVQKELCKAYWSYVESIITPIDPDSLEQTYTGMKPFCSFISNMRTDNKDMSTLKENSIILSDPKDKADGLNRQIDMSLHITDCVDKIHQKYLHAGFFMWRFQSHERLLHQKVMLSESTSK